MNEIEKRFKERKTISKTITVPELVWEEWQADCSAHFNDTYHLKMQFDHEFRKQFQTVSNLIIQDLVELKEEVFELRAELEATQQEFMNKSSQEDKKSGIRTYGGLQTAKK